MPEKTVEELQAEIAALSAEKQRWSSEQGRLKAVQTALSTAEQQKQALEAKIAEYEAAAKGGPDPVSVPDGLKEIIGDAGVAGFADTMAKLQQQNLEATRGMVQQMFGAQKVAQDFAVGIRDWERRNGAEGFFRTIQPGGRLAQSWEDYKMQHPSTAYAEKYLDTAAMVDHLDMFAKSEGLEFTPTPTSMAGGGGVTAFAPGAADSYSDKDYAEDMKRLNLSRVDGHIKPDEYKAEYAHLESCWKAKKVLPRSG